MLLRLFRGTTPGVIFLITITFIAVWLGAIIHPAEVHSSQFNSDPMPLYGLLYSIVGNSNFLGVALSIVIVVAISVLLVNFNTSSFFINERTYLPALFYILAGAIFPECQTLNPALPAALFLMLALIRIMDGYRKPGVANNFFDAGILVSTGSLFYANLIWFGLLVIIGIMLIRTVNLSEILITIMGLLAPYLITFGIYYVIGKDIRGLVTVIAENFFLRSEGYFYSMITIIALIVATLVLIVSISHLVSLLNTKKIKSRKTFSLLIWAFLLAVTINFIMPTVSVQIVWITAIPVSYFLTHFFLFTKKKLMSEIILSLLFLMVLIIQLSYYK